MCISQGSFWVHSIEGERKHITLFGLGTFQESNTICMVEINREEQWTPSAGQQSLQQTKFKYYVKKMHDVILRNNNNV